MASIIERKKNGTSYFYLERSIKIRKGKWKKVSIYIGKDKPSKKELKTKEKELEKKYKKVMGSLYDERLSKYSFSFLSKKELSEVERIKDTFLARFEKLSEKKKEAFRKKQVIDFVYTTLRTEGIDVDFSNVETAFTILKKRKREYTFDKKVIISSTMITGLNFLPKIKFNEKDVLRLHGIIMSSSEDKSPGQIRDDQRIIAKFDALTFQSKEINYRPPNPEKVASEYKNFFNWFNSHKNTHPLELAALVHLKLYLIHPFKDGNKRMCRLLFNKVLQDTDYPILNISKDTSHYFKELIKSVESGDEKFFVTFCYNTFLKQIKHRRLN
ncbi:MAG: Fic family protein [Candidatus Diapherotrites archaeon]